MSSRAHEWSGRASKESKNEELKGNQKELGEPHQGLLGGPFEATAPKRKRVDVILAKNELFLVNGGRIKARSMI